MPVNVIGTLKPKNNGKFPVAEAVDIKVTDNLRLDEALENKADLSSVNFALNQKTDKTTTNDLQAQIDNIVRAPESGGDVAAEVAQARVDSNGINHTTLKARLDYVDSNTFSYITSSINSIYNYDYGFEEGTINTAGEEVPGDKNNYRSNIISPNSINGQTISVINSSRYLAVAYYSENTFVQRTLFVQNSITIPADNEYNIRIIISNLIYTEGDTLEDVLEGINLPVIKSLSTINSRVDDLSSDLEAVTAATNELNISIHGSNIELQYTDGVISDTGIVSPTPTDKGNVMSQLIKAAEYQSINMSVASGYYGNYCKYQNGEFISRGSWQTNNFVIDNEGFDVILLFASVQSGHTAEDVLANCNAEIYYPSVDEDISQVKQSITQSVESLSFINKIMCCDSGRNIIHFSVDDTWICLYDIITHNYESIFETSFFAALKSLHENYGICVTLNTFNTFSETPDYDISDLPSTYQSELQENKNWLKFAFHAESDQSNYNTSSGISAAYDKFVSAIYTFTGDYDCIDTVTRLGYFGGNLNNVLAIKNKEHGIIGLLCADTTDRDSYYLSENENKLVQSKGKYYDLSNELVFIKTITRTLSNATAEIEANVCYQKYVEIFCHEYEPSAPNGFTSIAQYSVQKGYFNAFPSDIFK